MKRFGTIFSSLLLSFGIGLFLYAFCLIAIPKHHVSAIAWLESSFADEYDAANQGEVNNAAYVHRTFSGTLRAPSCGISPIIYMCSNSPVTIGELQKKSVIGMTTNVITATFTQPPASTYAFIQDMGQTLGFMPKQTYAQGIGLTGLSPLLPLWKAFRDVAYALLAVVMIVIGFMVMLRKKIDPKTVVTVQNALPRIVITTLLITFSYAIVAIIIDLMYLVILVVLSLFQSTTLLTGPDWYQQATGINTNKTSQELYTKGDLLTNLNHIRITPWQILGLPVPDDQNGFKQQLINIFSMNPVSGMVVGLILSGTNPGNENAGAAIGQGLTAGLFGGLSMSLWYFLLSLAMLFLFIRLTVLFVGAYIQIVISLLFGPIQILFEAIPGSTSFSSWLKNLVANVSVFPVGAGMFMLSNVFATFANNSGQKLWAPPFVGIMNSVTSLGALIGIGVLFTIPTVAGQIKEALKAKPAVGVGAGGMPGQVTSSAMQLWQLYTSKRTMDAFSKMTPGGGGNSGAKHG